MGDFQARPDENNLPGQFHSRKIAGSWRFLTFATIEMFSHRAHPDVFQSVFEAAVALNLYSVAPVFGNMYFQVVTSHGGMLSAALIVLPADLRYCHHLLDRRA